MTNTRGRVTVLGAGLVGSVLSLYLAKHGFRVGLYESKTDPRNEDDQGGRSINLTIAERGWKAFRDVGIDALIEGMALRMNGRLIHRTDGSVLFQSYGAKGESLFAIKRAALNKTLVEILAHEPNVELHFDHRCVNIDPYTATAKFMTQRGQSVSVTSASPIFCSDGAYSVARRALMRHLPDFQVSHKYSQYCYKELRIHPAPGGSYQLPANALHLWPRKNYIVVAFPNLDRSFTVTMILPFNGNPGNPAFCSLSTPDELRLLLETDLPDLARIVPDWREQYFSARINPIETIRCSPWSFQDKVVLIGDAAHVLVPFLGQGLNAGLEDCTVLMECIDRHGDDWERSFQMYYTLRKHNIDAIAHLAEEHFRELAEHINDPKFILRRRIEHKLHDLYPEKFLSIYNLITFTRLPYVEARSQRAQHEALVELLLGLDQIEERFNTPEFDNIVHKMMNSP